MDPEIPYLAGFFDADGWLGIARVGGKWHRLRMNVTNTDLDPLYRCLARWGGHVHARGDPMRPTHLQSYSWVVDLTTNPQPLLDVLPYLTVKRRQALLGLRAIREVLAPTPRTRRFAPIDPALVERRDWYRRAMSEQKKRRRTTLVLPLADARSALRKAAP